MDISRCGKSFESALTRFFDFCAGSPLLWLTLFIFSLLSVVDLSFSDFYKEYLHLPDFLFYTLFVSFAAFKATALTLIYNWLKKWKITRVLMIIFLSIYCFLSLVNGISALLYGVGISYKLCNLIYETNPAEIKGFVPGLFGNIINNLFSLKFLAAIISIAVIYLMLKKIKRCIVGLFLAILSVVGVFGFGYVYTHTVILRNAYFVIPKTCVSIKSLYNSIEFVKRYKDVEKPLPFPETLHSQNLASNVILVIGESASRNHLSLYGYPLSTTPRLDTLKNDLFIFTDAVASAPATFENLPRILTFMSDKDDDVMNVFSYPSLFQIFKKLGYRTYWLSNQEQSGTFSNLSGILSQQTDCMEYLGALNTNDHLDSRYDDILLPPFEAALADTAQRRLVCLHLMGSHTEYSNRFPSDRGHIKAQDVLAKVPKPWLSEKKAQTVADYDNSILYTDSILSVIIRDIAAQETPSVMIYVADHGECVYDMKDFVGRDVRFVDVPFIIYANEAYCEANPEIVNRLQSAVDQPFSTSETIQMIMSLAGISYRYYSLQEDPLSDSFQPRTRLVNGSPYRR